MRVLGLFAKEPRAGQVKTRLAEQIGVDLAKEFYTASLLDLTDRFGLTGDRRILGYSPDSAEARQTFTSISAGRYTLWPQPTTSLGDRIEAFFDMAMRGCTSCWMHVVLIGTDSPNLPSEFVATAFHMLEDRDVVLGPATDGGYYLIGLRVHAAGWLHKVRWSTSTTLADTVAAVEQQGWSLGLLSPWYDIDVPSDLVTLAGHLAAERVAHPQSPMTRIEDWCQRTAEQWLPLVQGR